MDISKLKNENGPRPRRHSAQQEQSAADTLVTEQSAAPEATDTPAESSPAQSAAAPATASQEHPAADAAITQNKKTCPLHISESGHFPPCPEATCAWYDAAVKACAVLAQTKPPHRHSYFLPRTLTLD